MTNRLHDEKLNSGQIKLINYRSMIGANILDRYSLEELIGLGGMGAVFRGVQKTINRPIAVKLLPKMDPLTAARFHREAKLVSRLHHPNTITVFDFGETPDGFLFLVMEYLDGKTLKAILEEEGAMTVPRAAHIAIQLCRSLSEAHSKGIVHRDVKPENLILINRNNDPDFVKVLDFGIAKVLAKEDSNEIDLTQQGRIVGTPRYMAPEQVLGHAIDHRADIYSLSTILYQMLTGMPPFEGNSTPALMMKHAHEPPPSFSMKMDAISLEQIPEQLEAIVMQGLSKSPNDRPQSIDLLRNALEVFSQNPSQTRSVSIPAVSVQLPGLDRPFPNHTTPANIEATTLDNISHSGPWVASSDHALSQVNPAVIMTSGPYQTIASPGSSRLVMLLSGMIVVLLLILGGVVALLWSKSNDSNQTPSQIVTFPATATKQEPEPIPQVSTISLIIESEPSNAQIFARDVFVGNTPKTFEVALDMGSVTYTLRKFGYLPIKHNFELGDLPLQTPTLWRASLIATNQEAPSKDDPKPVISTPIQNVTKYKPRRTKFMGGEKAQPKSRKQPSTDKKTIVTEILDDPGPTTRVKPRIDRLDDDGPTGLLKDEQQSDTSPKPKVDRLQ